MAKKADLEATYRRYAGACGLAAAAEKAGDFRSALRQCEAALPFMSGAVAYQKRFRKIETPRLVPVEKILKLAPPVFGVASLDAVDRWRGESKPAERKANPDLPGRVLKARRRMAAASRVWAAFESGAPAETDDELKLAQVWIGLGCVAAVPAAGGTRYRVVTSFRKHVEGKCPECGSLHRGAYSDFLDDCPCPRCFRTVPFTILRRI